MRSIFGTALAISSLFVISQNVIAADLSTQGMGLFKQAKYTEAAGAFARSYAKTHSATDCYYTALSYHYGRNSELARKFYQETVQKFPASREAGLAQQALTVSRPTTTTRVRSSNTSVDNSSTQAAPTNSANVDPIDDLLGKASFAEQANQFSTADASYADALRLAEKQGMNNPKIIEVLDQAANYYARHKRTDKGLAAYDRQRELIKIRSGQDSLPFGNNYLAIARMFKNDDNLEDARSHYYQAIDVYANALQDAENKSGNAASQPRALLAGTLDELADYLYNTVYSARGYGTLQISTQQVEIEIAKLRARAERVRASN